MASKARRSRAATHAGDIIALSPLVIGMRLAELSVATPYGFAVSMRGFALEKSLAAFEASAGIWAELTTQAIATGFGRAALPRHAAEGLANAALKPVARRVRANAAATRSKSSK
jgi:hypothetical protein